MPRRRTLVVLAWCIVAMLVAGCPRPDSATSPPGPRTVTDDIGRRVTLPARPTRIISLAPSLTESLCFLGYDSLLVGVTDFCDWPESVRALPRMGGIINPDLEAVIAARPDLVLLSVEGNSRRSFEVLEAAGIPTFVSNPRNLDGILATLADIDSLCAVDDRGVRRLDSLRRSLDLAPGPDRSAARCRVLMVISIEPLIVAGDSTFIGEMFRRVGASNLASGMPGNYPAINREAVVLGNPDLILIPTDVGMDTSGIFARFPEWRTVAAGRTSGLVSIDANLVLRPGPRAFEGLRLLGSLVAEWAKKRQAMRLPG